MAGEQEAGAHKESDCTYSATPFPVGSITVDVCFCSRCADDVLRCTGFSATKKKLFNVDLRPNRWVEGMLRGAHKQAYAHKALNPEWSDVGLE